MGALVIGLLDYVILVPCGGSLIWLEPQWTRLIGIVVTTACFAILNSSLFNGQTIGKWLLRLQVVDVNGQPVPFGKAALRALIYVFPTILGTYGTTAVITISSVPFAYISLLGTVLSLLTVILVIAGSPSRQALHDLVCNTYVVETWTSGRVTVEKATGSALLKCGLIALLITIIPIAIIYYEAYPVAQSIVSQGIVEQYSGLSVPIPGVIDIEANPLADNPTVTATYVGKESPRTVAERVEAQLAADFPQETLTIITLRRIDLIGAVREDTAYFVSPPGEMLQQISYKTSIKLGAIAGSGSFTYGW